MDINDYNLNKTATSSYENKEIDILSKVIFSKKNINIIQKKIIESIKKNLNYTITKQSNDILMNVISVIYYNNANHDYKNKSEIVSEVKRLNQLIIDACVTDISKNLKEHLIYLKKIDNDFCVEQITPWNFQGQNVSKKGSNSLELKYNNF
tara:strand:- start:34 stop:486 length:453 start_codon:yes stop_codon:yes gene_type:complete